MSTVGSRPTGIGKTYGGLPGGDGGGGGGGGRGSLDVLFRVVDVRQFETGRRSAHGGGGRRTVGN